MTSHNICLPVAAFPPALGFCSAINTTGSGVEIPRLTLRQIVTVPLSSGTVTFGVSKFTANTVRGEGQADKMEEKSEREEDRGGRKQEREVGRWSNTGGELREGGGDDGIFFLQTSVCFYFN